MQGRVQQKEKFRPSRKPELITAILIAILALVGGYLAVTKANAQISGVTQERSAPTQDR